jgi:ATP-binding cassette, subfamily F, member 3
MLHINDLTYRLGTRLLLDKATVALPPDARVGLVGRNGVGKTTLFRLIQGDIPSEGGSVSVPKGLRIGSVAQEAPGGPESLIEVVLAADKERAQLLADADTAEGLARAEIETRLIDIDAHAAPARAAAILHGLGFDAAAQARPCSSFSGGWRMRVALAAVLFTEPDLLLLDEPTNYLDLEGTLWLYDYLTRYPRTALIISHDRDLLDTCVDHILHMDEGRLVLYRGDYTSFERQRAEKQAQQSKLRTKQELERKHLTAFVDRFRAKASKARQAQSRLKRLEKLQPIAAMVDSEVLPFDLPGPERPLSPPIAAFENVSVGYDDKVILSRINLSLLPDDRIALLGSNGNGKSTFCKLLAKRLEPMSGDAKRSGKMKVAYFAQHQLDELKPAESVYLHIAALMPNQPESRVRSRAARMGFPGSKADTPVEKLSGGEKARLMMGLATFHGPHLLILDEPTNHLDIDSRAALMEALNEYNGAVILVSHDRFLVEACADRFWLVSGGSVSAYDGDMDDYRKLVLSGPPSAPRTRPDAAISKDGERKQAASKRLDVAPLRKRAKELEERIDHLTGLIARVDTMLGKGDAYQNNLSKAAELARQRAELAIALERTEENWLNVTAEIEANK